MTFIKLLAKYITKYPGIRLMGSPKEVTLMQGDMMCFDAVFSECIKPIESFVNEVRDLCRALDISQKPFCKNGKHMRKTNYIKAYCMDSRIKKSRNK